MAAFNSADAAPRTFHDFIVAPIDLAANVCSGAILFHEFGHGVRHVAIGADGNPLHSRGVGTIPPVAARACDMAQDFVTSPVPQEPAVSVPCSVAISRRDSQTTAPLVLAIRTSFGRRVIARW